MAARRLTHPSQGDLFAPQVLATRALLDQLIAETGLYSTSESLADLLEFVARLRRFAPFNAMLLHAQKPGLTHAATARDWRERFERMPKPDARPLIVLRTMGPVDFVFDVQDTWGKPLPEDAFSFPALGDLSDGRFERLIRRLPRQRIEIAPIDAGDAVAGRIELVRRSRKDKNLYRLVYNRNHSAPTRFATVAHELAHLFLGHLGGDPVRKVPDRHGRDHALREVEAETVAWLVARRAGAEPRSAKYLRAYQGSFAALDLYAVMRAVNAVENLLGIPGLARGKGKAMVP